MVAGILYISELLLQGLSNQVAGVDVDTGNQAFRAGIPY